MSRGVPIRDDLVVIEAAVLQPDPPIGVLHMHDPTPGQEACWYTVGRVDDEDLLPTADDAWRQAPPHEWPGPLRFGADSGMHVRWLGVLAAIEADAAERRDVDE